LDFVIPLGCVDLVIGVAITGAINTSIMTLILLAELKSLTYQYKYA
jgi:hypothetical protein